MEHNPYKIVEDNILVRFDPSIYAFSTNTIPNYLKVGDTFRGVDTRIAEWESLLAKRLAPQQVRITKEYSHSAKVNDDLYFRDYSVHQFLRSIGKASIAEIDANLLKLYSEEFFRDTDANDVAAAINAILDDIQSDDPVKIYKYYRTIDRNNADFHYNNDKDWKLRPNQEEVVRNYLNKPDIKEYLMYAVMRFGKSFTAMQCALQSDCKKVLIVSAKADVQSEWKRTIEMPSCFKEFSYICDRDFQEGRTLDSFLEKRPKYAIFLTLQNLSGKTSDGKSIKKRLKSVYETEFDLIIIDETHFGAWADSYGAPIKAEKEEDKDYLTSEKNDFAKLLKETGKINCKKKLHLSGTPYNLLYDNQFEEESIIATCQFKDILDAKRNWEKEHFEDIEVGIINPETGKPYQEFDNPYFGFPQMLRFAFNLPKEARAKLAQSKKAGKAWMLNDLFATTNIDQVVKFDHEAEVLGLLKAIDGSEPDDDVLGFLNVPRIKDNQVCKHIVMVLPFKYCCDAMEQLLEKHQTDFINLGNYKVLNITGHTVKQELNDTDKVKAIIEQSERAGEKTITLTVQKMLTGVTVKEWDTMIMLKNTKSAQEYDQAVFRVQNQYVIEKENEDGEIIKIDMKPQTILVDFDPMRMFEIQGLSTRIVNEVVSGNDSLEDSIRKELEYFPIITYNAKQLVKVEPQNLVEIITKYSSEKSIMDEASKIMLDSSLLEDEYLRQFIQAQSPADLSNPLTVDAHNGPESSFDTAGLGNNGENDEDDNQADPANSTPGNSDSNGTSAEALSESEMQKRYRMCIANLSFYAFLSHSNIETLKDVIHSIQEDNAESIRNRRIFKNLNLDERFIQKLIHKNSPLASFAVNDALRKANMLSKDSDLSPEQRAINAFHRFSRISDSEVVTPLRICREMIDSIGTNQLSKTVKDGGRILDIAGKTGEYVYTLYAALKDHVDDAKLKNAFYTIPTSSITYEFTRLMYEILGLNVHNIACRFSTYDLLQITDRHGNVDYKRINELLTQNKLFDRITLQDTVVGEEAMKFDAIVGNPPYHADDGGAQASAKALYNQFVGISKGLNPSYMTIIMPSRWYAGGKNLDDFREEMLNDPHIQELHDFLHPEEIFPGTNNRGGICFVTWNKTHDNTTQQVKIVTHLGGDRLFVSNRTLNYRNLGIFVRNSQAIDIIEKVVPNGATTLQRYVSYAV